MATSPVQVKQTAPARASAGVPDAFRSFRNEIDRLFDRFTTGFGWPSLALPSFPAASAGDGFAVPAVDVTEDDKAFKIAAELPGMDEKDVEVAVSGDTLTIKGEKRQERETKEPNYYLCERSYGSFQRAFVLPDGIDRDKIDARFAKGVLTVTLPKTPEVQRQAKKIEVKASA